MMMNALAIAFFAAPFLVMLGAGLLVPAFVVMAYHRFTWGAYAVVGWFFVEAALHESGGINLGINIFYTDLVMVMLGGVAGLRLLFAQDFPRRHVGWLVFCVVAAASLVIGLAQYGALAGVQARGYFYYGVAGLYAMSFPVGREEVQKVVGAVALSSLAFMALVAYRWVVFYAPIPELLPQSGNYNVDGEIRVISSNHALLLAQVLIAVLFAWPASKRLKGLRPLAPLLFGFVVALQHRSVWLAFVVGSAFALILNRSRSASVASQVWLLGAMLAATVGVAAFTGEGGVGQQLQRSAVRALEAQDTTGGRLRDWKVLIQQWYEAGPRSIAIGRPFGTETARVVEDEAGRARVITYYAHNMYIQTLVNMGAIGLAGLLAAFWTVASRLYRRCTAEEDWQARVLLLWMGMQFVYFVPYGQDYLQSLLFGTALAYVSAGWRKTVPYLGKLPPVKARL